MVRVGGWLCVLVAVVVVSVGVSVGGTGYFLVSMLLMVVVGSHLFRKQFSNSSLGTFVPQSTFRITGDDFHLYKYLMKLGRFPERSGSCKTFPYQL